MHFFLSLSLPRRSAFWMYLYVSNYYCWRVETGESVLAHPRRDLVCMEMEMSLFQQTAKPQNIYYWRQTTQRLRRPRSEIWNSSKTFCHLLVLAYFSFRWVVNFTGKLVHTHLANFCACEWVSAQNPKFFEALDPTRLDVERQAQSERWASVFAYILVSRTARWTTDCMAMAHAPLLYVCTRTYRLGNWCEVEIWLHRKHSSYERKLQRNVATRDACEIRKMLTRKKAKTFSFFSQFLWNLARDRGTSARCSNQNLISKKKKKKEIRFIFGNWEGANVNVNVVGLFNFNLEYIMSAFWLRVGRRLSKR